MNVAIRLIGVGSFKNELILFFNWLFYIISLVLCDNDLDYVASCQCYSVYYIKYDTLKICIGQFIVLFYIKEVIYVCMY